MESYKTHKREVLKNPELRKMYDALSPEFLVIEKLIETRLKKGLSQSDLAGRIGTKQSAISRFESGNYNPTVSFLCKVADALDTKLRITIS